MKETAETQEKTTKIIVETSHHAVVKGKKQPNPLNARAAQQAVQGESDYCETVTLKTGEETQTIGVTELLGKRKIEEDRVSVGVLENFSQLENEETKKAVLIESVSKLQTDIKNNLGNAAVNNGSCYISVVTEQDPQAKNKFTFYTTNVGDSLAFLVRVKANGKKSVERLNQHLHSVAEATPEELERIETAGGWIYEPQSQLLNKLTPAQFKQLQQFISDTEKKDTNDTEDGDNVFNTIQQLQLDGYATAQFSYTEYETIKTKLQQQREKIPEQTAVINEIIQLLDASRPDVPRLNGDLQLCRSLGDLKYDGSVKGSDVYSLDDIPDPIKIFLMDKLGIPYFHVTKDGKISITRDELTKKKSPQELKDLGIDIDNDNQIWISWQGLSHKPEVDVKPIELEAGETAYLVMGCDGLQENDAVPDETLGEIIANAHQQKQTPEAIALHLANTAIKQGSKDNVSVMVCKLDQDTVLPQPTYMGIYDGHGLDKGHVVSEHCRTNALHILQDSVEKKQALSSKRKLGLPIKVLLESTVENAELRLQSKKNGSTESNPKQSHVCLVTDKGWFNTTYYICHHDITGKFIKKKVGPSLDKKLKQIYADTSLNDAKRKNKLKKTIQKEFDFVYGQSGQFSLPADERANYVWTYRVLEQIFKDVRHNKKLLKQLKQSGIDVLRKQIDQQIALYAKTPEDRAIVAKHANRALQVLYTQSPLYLGERPQKLSDYQIAKRYWFFKIYRISVSEVLQLPNQLDYNSSDYRVWNPLSQKAKAPDDKGKEIEGDIRTVHTGPSKSILDETLKKAFQHPLGHHSIYNPPADYLNTNQTNDIDILNDKNAIQFSHRKDGSIKKSRVNTHTPINHNPSAAQKNDYPVIEMGEEKGQLIIIDPQATDSKWHILSNDAPTPIQLDLGEKFGKVTFPTAEHFVQWTKCQTQEHLANILNCPTAQAARECANQITWKIEQEKAWKEKRAYYLYYVAMEKAKQHPHMLNVLLMTGDASLLEKTDGMPDANLKDGNANLGLVLMATRNSYLTRNNCVDNETQVLNIPEDIQKSFDIGLAYFEKNKTSSLIDKPISSLSHSTLANKIYDAMQKKAIKEQFDNIRLEHLNTIIGRLDEYSVYLLCAVFLSQSSKGEKIYFLKKLFDGVNVKKISVDSLKQTEIFNIQKNLNTLKREYAHLFQDRAPSPNASLTMTQADVQNNKESVRFYDKSPVAYSKKKNILRLIQRKEKEITVPGGVTKQDYVDHLNGIKHQVACTGTINRVVDQNGRILPTAPVCYVSYGLVPDMPAKINREDVTSFTFSNFTTEDIKILQNCFYHLLGNKDPMEYGDVWTKVRQLKFEENEHKTKHFSYNEIILAEEVLAHILASSHLRDVENLDEFKNQAIYLQNRIQVEFTRHRQHADLYAQYIHTHINAAIAAHRSTGKPFSVAFSLADIPEQDQAIFMQELASICQQGKINHPNFHGIVLHNIQGKGQAWFGQQFRNKKPTIPLAVTQSMDLHSTQAQGLDTYIVCPAGSATEKQLVRDSVFGLHSVFGIAHNQNLMQPPVKTVENELEPEEGRKVAEIDANLLNQASLPPEWLAILCQYDKVRILGWAEYEHDNNNQMTNNKNILRGILGEKLQVLSVDDNKGQQTDKVYQFTPTNVDCFTTQSDYARAGGIKLADKDIKNVELFYFFQRIKEENFKLNKPELQTQFRRFTFEELATLMEWCHNYSNIPNIHLIKDATINNLNNHSRYANSCFSGFKFFSEKSKDDKRNALINILQNGPQKKTEGVEPETPRHSV